jgi:hypothetical protein
MQEVPVSVQLRWISDNISHAAFPKTDFKIFRQNAGLQTWSKFGHNAALTT